MRYLLLAATLLANATAFAEPPRGPSDGENMMDRRLEQMTENLDLTEKQQDKIRDIMEDHRAAMKKQHERSEKRMRKVLTDEQIGQMEAMREKRRERFKEMMEQRRERRSAE